MRSSLHFLSGSVVVYALMAACSGGGGGASTPGSGGMTSSGGSIAAAGFATGGSFTSTGGANTMMNPVPDANAETKSGTRLKARYYVGADGSKQFVGWRDTMRNEDCGFQKTDDGTLRCLPAPSYVVYYADAGCTQPLGNMVTGSGSACPGGVAAPVYFAESKCGGFKLHKAGGTTTPTMVFSGSPGACNGGPAPAIYTFYTTTPIADTDFEAATEQVE